jgi:predicted PurR-regulated permease PerM
VAAGTWSAERAAHLGLLLQTLLQRNVLGVLNGARLVLDAASGALLQAAMALLFSFLLVFDLPTIAKGVRSLRHSRLSYAYAEVTPKVINFSAVFGTAFECTVLMALVNTALTFLGMVCLKLPAAFFLSLLVFLSSFVPVLGKLDFVKSKPQGQPESSCQNRLTNSTPPLALALSFSRAVVH